MSDPADPPEYAGDFILVRNNVDDDQDDGGIAFSEWETLISSDPTLEPVEAIFGRNPATGERIRVPLRGGVKWTGHPIGVDLPFSWSHGQIHCFALDQLTLAKVQELAAELQVDCIEKPW